MDNRRKRKIVKRKIVKPVITKRRMNGMAIFIVLILIGLILRLSYIMIFQKSKLYAMATEQWTSEIQIEAKRGNILDRNGNELAVSADVYRVDLDLITLRSYLKDKGLTYDAIAPKIADALGMEVEDVMSKLTYTLKSGAPANSVILARRIESEPATKVKALKIGGIVVSHDTKRYYTNNNFLAQVLGTTNSDGKGLSGVELQYNKELSGIPGVRIAETDRNNEESPYSTPSFTPAVDGKDIVLTIDEKIQFIAENIATKAINDNTAKSATVIVTNPQNGEVLAMVNKPDFNPNKPTEGAEKFEGEKIQDKINNMWSNWAIGHSFEPGSTFKILTTYAALKEGVVTDEDKFYCPGYEIVNGVRINCWKPEGHGSENLQEILNNSCNPGFMQLVKKIGKEKMNEYIRMFGLGKVSGIDLPGESAGIIKDTDKISPVDLATISFGQTDSVNAIQFMTAINAVANGGKLIQPHVMKEVSHLDDKGNKVVDRKFEPKTTEVLDPQTCARVREYLKNVVSQAYKKTAYVEGYDIAGKTGTAEKAGKGGYKDKKYVASFVGFAPSDNPKISVMILIDEPTGDEHFAGIIVAPLVKELFTDIFNYYDIKTLQKEN